MAESYGLLVRPDEIQPGLKRAFKEMASQHPLYGKYSKPALHYEEWWSMFIERTFQYADVPESGE